MQKTEVPLPLLSYPLRIRTIIHVHSAYFKLFYDIRMQVNESTALHVAQNKNSSDMNSGFIPSVLTQ